MKMLFTIFLMLLICTQSQAGQIPTYADKNLIRPFGYLNHRRPPAHARTVTIIDHVIDFSANQVCGYTDWSTAVIKLPKELLTMKYWENVGKNLAKQATDSVLAITGALPSMLACNVSPTFCAIMNRAEALAQANLKFTFDSCQMLEGLNDVTQKSFTALSSCVKGKTDNGMASNSAVESCMLGDKSAGANKKEKSETASSQAKDSFLPQDFFKKACKEIEYANYSSSSQSYSVSELSCEWMKEFFPGISLRAGSVVKHGGTFSNSGAEKKYEDTIEKTGKFLVDLLEQMHDIRYGKGHYSSQGPLPRHLVINHPDVWSALGQLQNGKLKGICYPEDGTKCKTDISKLPPVYRFSMVGGLPSLLIHPASLYEILEVIPKGSSPRKEYEVRDSQISYILEHLIQSVAYAKTQDIVRDSYQRTIDACKNEPSLQSSGAQEDCNAKISKLEAEKESLRTRNETDRNHVQSQILFYSEIERLKSSRIQIKSEEKNKSFIDPILDPSKI